MEHNFYILNKIDDLKSLIIELNSNNSTINPILKYLFINNHTNFKEILIKLNKYNYLNYNKNNITLSFSYILDNNKITKIINLNCSSNDVFSNECKIIIDILYKRIDINDKYEINFKLFPNSIYNKILISKLLFIYDIVIENKSNIDLEEIVKSSFKNITTYFEKIVSLIYGNFIYFINTHILNLVNIYESNNKTILDVSIKIVNNYKKYNDILLKSRDRFDCKLNINSENVLSNEELIILKNNNNESNLCIKNLFKACFSKFESTNIIANKFKDLINTLEKYTNNLKKLEIYINYSTFDLDINTISKLLRNSFLHNLNIEPKLINTNYRCTVLYNFNNSILIYIKNSEDSKLIYNYLIKNNYKDKNNIYLEKKYTLNNNQISCRFEHLLDNEISYKISTNMYKISFSFNYNFSNLYNVLIKSNSTKLSNTFILIRLNEKIFHSIYSIYNNNIQDSFFGLILTQHIYLGNFILKDGLTNFASIEKHGIGILYYFNNDILIGNFNCSNYCHGTYYFNKNNNIIYIKSGFKLKLLDNNSNNLVIDENLTENTILFSNNDYFLGSFTIKNNNNVKTIHLNNGTYYSKKYSTNTIINKDNNII